MARSTQNDPQRQLGLEVEPPQDRAEVARPQDSPYGRSLPAQETLNFGIGHAGLRSECWAALAENTLRLPRRARKRAPLHRARPPHAAEARLVSLAYEVRRIH
jgi:hypothetical protein